MQHEQLHHIESAPRIEIPKSRRMFEGNPEVGVGESFNHAVILAQRLMGPDYYLTKDSFGAIMSSNWDRKKAGAALEEFDKAYEQFVLQKLGYNQDEISLIATDEDTTTPPETTETDYSEVRWIDKAGQEHPDTFEAEAERRENLDAFNALVAAHPELEALRADFLQDLEVYIRDRYMDPANALTSGNTR